MKKERIIQKQKELIIELTKALDYLADNNLIKEQKDNDSDNQPLVEIVNKSATLRKDIARIESIADELQEQEKYPVIAIEDIDAEMVKRWYQELIGYDEAFMKIDIQAMARASYLNKHLNWELPDKDLTAGKFLFQKGILKKGFREWIIRFSDGREFDLVKLLNEFASQNREIAVSNEDIETWAREKYDAKNCSEIKYAKYKGAIEGAKAMRDGKIKHNKK
jgi:hypothetical protein